MGKIISGNTTSGIEKLDNGKYVFKVRLGTNQTSSSEFGLFDRRQTTTAKNDTEAKRLYKQFVQEKKDEYLQEKTAFKTKTVIKENQFLAEDAAIQLTFKEYTYFGKNNDVGLFWNRIPRNQSGDSYSQNTINLLHTLVKVVNSEKYAFFNEKRLAEISHEDAQKLLDKLGERKKVINKAENIYEPISNAMLQKYINNLKIIFNSLESTVKLRKHGTNPFANLKAGTIKYKKDGKTSLDTVEEYGVVKEELKSLLGNEPDTSLFCLFAMISMLRRSEIAALTWDNLNFEDKIIDIKGVLVEDTSTKEIIYRKYTKSDEVRISVMNNELIEILKRFKSTHEPKFWASAGVKHDLIFTDKNGNLLRLNYWTDSWRLQYRPALIKKGLIKKKNTLHDLRGSGISII